MFKWLKYLFNKFIRAFKSFIRIVFTSSTQIIIGQLKDFAISVVILLNSRDLTNEEKRKEAFKQIKEEAIKRGLKVKDSIINLLIELAVQYVKNIKGRVDAK